MSKDRRDLLRRYLEVIHEKFEELYCVQAGERFAMEIEFKITSEDILAIKQARPWVFIGAQATGCAEEDSNRPATGAPVITSAAQVGETLTAGVSGIADPDGLDNAAFAYQWLADGEPVEGSAEASYTLVEEDSGKTITVSVSFTDDAGNEESLESDPTEAVSATTPGAPRGVSVSPLDTGSLDVRWEAPGSDGGSPVTGYRVQWRRASASWDETAEVSEAMAAATSHTIAGLEYGEEYAVRIIAVNEAGEGALSAQQTGRPAEPAEPPPAPQNLTATLGPGSVTLTWDPRRRQLRHRLPDTAAAAPAGRKPAAGARGEHWQHGRELHRYRRSGLGLPPRVPGAGPQLRRAGRRVELRSGRAHGIGRQGAAATALGVGRGCGRTGRGGAELGRAERGQPVPERGQPLPD